MPKTLRNQLESRLRSLQKEMSDLSQSGVMDYERQVQILRVIDSVRNNIDVIDTSDLVTKATRLGIDIPNREEWWRNDEREMQDSSGNTIGAIRQRLLTELGKTGTTKLIKDERRKDIEWRLKIIGSIIASLTGLIGTIIGLIALLKKSSL